MSEVFLFGYWQMYRDTIEFPIALLEFKADGKIVGGPFNEKFWKFEESRLSILAADYTITTSIDIQNEYAPISTMTGTFHGEFQGRRDVIHIFRKLGGRKMCHAGPLSLNTADPATAREIYNSNIDFSFIIEPAQLIASNYHVNSAYYGHIMHESGNLIFEKEYRSDTLFLNILHDCSLINGTVVIDKRGNPIFETTYQAESRSRRSKYQLREDGNTLYFEQQPTTCIEDQTSFLFNTVLDNYGHWHTQGLVNLYFIEKLSSFGIDAFEWKLYCAPGLDRDHFRAPSIARFGYESADVSNPAVERNGNNINFRKLIIPSTLMLPKNLGWPRFFCEAYRKLSHHVAEQSLPKSKLYLTRRDVNRRAILNEDDLIHELARRGFSIVYCAELSYEQQEAVFRSATVIVSAHGGALTNMIFSAPGAIIIELFHGMQINPWYKNLANILNHRYGFIGFDLPNPMGSWYSDFTVDVPKVIDLVDAMQADSI